MLIEDFAHAIVNLENKYRIRYEYIVADSAGRRERDELRAL
jgi:hypothetical protein